MEKYLLQFLEFLPDKNFHFVLVRGKNVNNKGSLFEQYKKTSVNIYFQRIGYLNVINWLKLYRFYNKNQFFTVCDFNGNFAGITLLIANMAGIKNRIAFYRRSSNAFNPVWYKNIYNTILNRLVYKYATKILSNSYHALDFFFPYRKQHDERFSVIPNGVFYEKFDVKASKEEARIFLKLPLNKFIIGHVGRYDPSKNHETIFKVAKELQEKKKNVFFLFAGKNTDSSEFLRRIKEYEIENICCSLGLQSNMGILYRAMDLFYFPSLTEGQPNALIEAMLSGLPVVVSNIPSIKEIIPVSHHYFLLNPRDILSAAKTISQLIDDQDLLSKMIFKEEARLMFDPYKNFNLFLRELLNE